MQQHVKFGDMISLLGLNKMRGTQEDLLGFLSATGYGNNEIYLQRVEGDYEEEIETSHIINQRDFVFQM